MSASFGVRFLRSSVTWLRGHVISIVIDVLVLLVLAALVRSVAGLAMNVFSLMTLADADAFKTVTTQILTVFIFIEIFHSLIDYIEFQRVRV